MKLSHSRLLAVTCGTALLVLTNAGQAIAGGDLPPDATAKSTLSLQNVPTTLLANQAGVFDATIRLTELETIVAKDADLQCKLYFSAQAGLQLAATGPCLIKNTVGATTTVKVSIYSSKNTAVDRKFFVRGKILALGEGREIYAEHSPTMTLDFVNPMSVAITKAASSWKDTLAPKNFVIKSVKGKTPTTVATWDAVAGAAKYKGLVTCSTDADPYFDLNYPREFTTNSATFGVCVDSNLFFNVFAILDDGRETFDAIPASGRR